MYRQCIVTAAGRAYGREMNNRDQVRAFLVSRRGRITRSRPGCRPGARPAFPGCDAARSRPCPA
ncbi:hypothetical protein Ait01nite_057370 [Actinoplanes italicus]|nr:hypothetical protein Ait01nite_057370 [Actinoplanes italicus]